MADVHDLKAVLKDTLEKRGVIGQLKARVRAEVFEALDDRSEPRPPLSHENLLINELIREYLEFNKYKYTASVLSAESGLSEIPLDRSFLARELNIVEDSNSQSVPVLYGILSHFLKGSDYNGHCHNIQSAPTDRLRLGRFNVPDTHQEPVRVTQAIIKGSNPLHRMNT